jgi:hypothetical protein
MPVTNDVLPRRAFLEHVTIGATGVAAAALAISMPIDAAYPQEHAPSMQKSTETWDLAWIERINRPHRLVIDPTGSGEMAMGQLSNWMQGFADAYGKTDADLNGVIVFRHDAVGVVLTDAMQARLGRTNTNLSQSVDRYIGRGVIVLACNMALSGQSHTLSQRESIDQAEAHRQIRAAVRPGVYVMPNGVFAIGRAQDAGCGYLRA